MRTVYVIEGINGVKIKIFSSSMDTKGREELLSMTTCSSYQGCPACTHRCTKGTLVNRGHVICDGFRRYLCPHSRARQTRLRYRGHVYQYRNEETRSPPTTRDDNFVRKAVGMAAAGGRPFVGHKSEPLPARWPGFNWWRWNVSEIMHGNIYLLNINKHTIIIIFNVYLKLINKKKNAHDRLQKLM